MATKGNPGIEYRPLHPRLIKTNLGYLTETPIFGEPEEINGSTAQSATRDLLSAFKLGPQGCFADVSDAAIAARTIKAFISSKKHVQVYDVYCCRRDNYVDILLNVTCCLLQMFQTNIAHNNDSSVCFLQGLARFAAEI